MMDQVYFRESPFTVVASPTVGQCWAGRRDVRDRLQRVARSFSRRTDSSLDIMWANLGCGKTHTLYHLRHLLEMTQGDNTICLYVEMPEQIRHFLDLYKRVVVSLPLRRVAEAICGCAPQTLPDSLRRAGNVILNGGGSEQTVVSSWLWGHRPHLTDLKKCSGISERIETDVVATDVLCGIIKALATRRVRLVLMIDECQRMGVLKASSRDRVLSCIRSVFSHSPEYLSIVLSIMSRVEQTAMDLIPAELRTLIGKRPTISLPDMDVNDAVEFITERLAFFRPAGYTGGATWPFGDATVRAVCEYLHDVAEVVLTPREVLQAFAWVYDETSADSGEISSRDAIDLMKEAYGPKEPREQ